MPQLATTRDTIIKKTVTILAQRGYEGTSIREISLAAQVQPSRIYYYFKDKQALLRAVREYINATLRDGISHLPAGSADELLRQQLYFQIQHRELVVATLKYFMAMPQDFNEVQPGGGYIPQRAYAHSRAVIDRGLQEQVFSSHDADADAKTISHLINGFMMEYYPRRLTKTQVDQLVDTIADFIERALTSKPVLQPTKVAIHD